MKPKGGPGLKGDGSGFRVRLHAGEEALVEQPHSPGEPNVLEAPSHLKHFHVQGSGFGVQGLGFRVLGLKILETASRTTHRAGTYYEPGSRLGPWVLG